MHEAGTQTSGLLFDPMDPASYLDPWTQFSRLRDEAPAYRTAADFVVLSRYEDVRAVTGDAKRFSNSLKQGPAGSLPTEPEKRAQLIERIRSFSAGSPVPIEELVAARQISAADPPQHTRIRNIVNRGFTPRQISHKRGELDAYVEELLADIKEVDRFDVVSQLAAPLPIRIIGDLLGMDRDDHELIMEWTTDFSTGQFASDTGSDAAVERVLDVYRRVSLYFYPKLQEASVDAQDLTSAITRSEREDNLSLTEAMMFMFFLTVAGNENSRHHIGNMVVQLMRNPDQRRLLQEHPELIGKAVDEGLRHSSPVRLGFRLATEAVEVAGEQFSAGTKFLTLISSANCRDPRAYTDPDAFDVARIGPPQLAFGYGIHHCVGSYLAKLEAEAAVAAILPHLDRFELASEPVLVESWLNHGYRSIDLVAT